MVASDWFSLWFLQYLASVQDAPMLQPTESSIIAYNPMNSDDVIKVEDIKYVGRLSITPVLQFFDFLGTSCNALMSTADVLAKVKVVSLMPYTGPAVPARAIGFQFPALLSFELKVVY